MGSFSRPSMEKVLIVSLAFFFCSFYFFTNVWNLNAILLGDEHTRSLGLNIKNLGELIIITSFSTSACVSSCGVIGFVGIIVPHTMRLIFGDQNSYISALWNDFDASSRCSFSPVSAVNFQLEL
ncbi:MAG: iron ABC transporter permease [Archaeoglobaceae archaeon]|nr:iron ABC transporter permease [Archaeoglobaceae archaeon]MCX8152429.1 iron ABC transporter permease [Archaeoglobaceae archaeon]MDW8013769.1 iron chelate uptake ABC transporter family permease subunit [Archaeoglobaceae archaeon]